jgi:hypothetical protein
MRYEFLDEILCQNGFFKQICIKRWLAGNSNIMEDMSSFLWYQKIKISESQ